MPQQMTDSMGNPVSFKSQKEYVSKKVGKAIADYHMLADGDKIIVAVSGGKDSLSLLKLMQYRKTFVPIDFDLIAVFVDFGIAGYPVKELVDYIQPMGIECYVERTSFMEGKSLEEVDCFLCSWQRRKVLFQLAERFGCNKIALGHHMDDIAETILLNLFYRAEIGSMRPLQSLFDGKVILIRPLAYVHEREILKLCAEENIQTFDQCQCPHSGVSKRRTMKGLISRLEQENPNVKLNVIRSLQNIRTDYLP